VIFCISFLQNLVFRLSFNFCNLVFMFCLCNCFASAMTSSTKEIVWLRWLLANMRVFFSHPTPMYCDNQSSIQIAHNLVFHERTKHIKIDCHLTRHHLMAPLLCLWFLLPCRLQIFLPMRIPSLVFVF
jgi:hypothetical protein